MKRPYWLLGIAVATYAAGARAHHSIAAVYDTTRQVTVEGRVTEFLFINPHPVLIIEVAKDGGAPQPWRLELDNRSELADIGIDVGTFKPGDHVIATGSAGRKNSASLYALKIARPADGLLYEQIGYAPRINHPH
jgi:NADPH:quinone reductase-like Zn-dependent oxidoreductase